MRTVSPSLLAGLAVVTIAGAAWPAPPQAPTPTERNDVCLTINLIDHTRAPNNDELLIYMKNGKIWRSKLQRTCPGLKQYDAIRWIIRSNRVCANRQAFTVISRGNTCFLGPLTPYTPPRKHD